MLLVDDGAQVLVAAAITGAVEDSVGNLYRKDPGRAVFTVSAGEGHSQEVRERAAELESDREGRPDGARAWSGGFGRCRRQWHSRRKGCGRQRGEKRHPALC